VLSGIAKATLVEFVAMPKVHFTKIKCFATGRQNGKFQAKSQFQKSHVTGSLENLNLKLNVTSIELLMLVPTALTLVFGTAIKGIGGVNWFVTTLTELKPKSLALTTGGPSGVKTPVPHQCQELVTLPSLQILVKVP